MDARVDGEQGAEGGREEQKKNRKDAGQLLIFVRKAFLSRPKSGADLSPIQSSHLFVLEPVFLYGIP